MQINPSTPWLTVGAIVAIVVLLLAVLGLLNVVPDTTTVTFGLIALLAIARLT
jgi:undecaprenyl pyrophosphate phosphatase UppP